MSFSRYMNRPRLLFKYDMDTIIYGILVSLIPILMGIFSTYFIIGTLGGLITFYYFLKFYPKYAKKKTPGLMQHFFYDIGLTNPNNKKDLEKKSKNELIPPGYINEFIE